MGIDVVNKEVFYTDTHQELVDTSTVKNPYYQVVDGLSVTSVFRRRKSKGTAGDGNPLIYALKRYKGYRISPAQLIRFMPNVRKIVRVAMSIEPYDAIVVLPSSHPIAWTLALRAARYQREARLIRDLFTKCTNAEVVADLQQLLAQGGVERKDRRSVTSLIHTLSQTPDHHFSLKQVENQLRRYTNPFKLVGNHQLKGLSVLVVDDLLSSGTSLITARRLLNQQGARKLNALCLLSSLDGGRHHA